MSGRGRQPPAAGDDGRCPVDENGAGRCPVEENGAGRCPFEDDVLVLADGILEPSRRLVVEAHLGVCDACAALDDMLDRTASALRASPAPRLDATERALARLPSSRAPRILVAGVAAAALVAAWTLFARRDAPVVRTPATPRQVARSPSPPSPPETPVDDAAGSEDPTPFPTVPPAPDLDDVPAAVAALDLTGTDDDPALRAIARRIRSAGAAGSRALSDLLGSGDPDVAARALRVSASLRSTTCIRALGTLLDDERLAPEAARQLGAFGTPSAVAHLAEGLDGPARDAVLEALVATGSGRAFDVVESRLRADEEDPEPLLVAAVELDARRAARLLLDVASAGPGASDAADRVLRDRSAVLVPPLAELARSTDALVAAAAVRTLGATGDPEAIPALVSAASRPSLARRCAESLVAIGTDGAYAAAFDVATSPRTPRGSLAMFDDVRAAAPAVVPSLSDVRPSRREAAVEVLGRTGAAEAVPALAPCLDDPQLRRATVEALGRIGGDRAAALLARIADRRTADSRLVAALGSTRSPLAVTPLRSLARESSLAVPATMALGRIPSAGSVVALAELLASPRTARDAADALRALPAGLVVPTLLARLDDPDDDPDLGPAAHRALVLVAGRDLGPRAEEWSVWWAELAPERMEDQP